MSNPGKPTTDIAAPSEFDQFNSQLDDMLATTGAAAPRVTPEATPPGSLPPQDETTTDVPQQESKPGLLSRAATAVGKTVTGIAVGLARSPGQLAGSVLDTAKDAGKAGIAPLSSMLSAPEVFPGQHAIAAGLLGFGQMDHKGSYADQLSARKYLGTIGYAPVNQGVAELASFALGASALSEVRLAGGLSKIAPNVAKTINVAAQTGLAAEVTVDPHAARLSTMLSNLGVHSEFTDWLGATGDKEETAAEGRFKNAIEGAGLGAATEAAFLGGKYLWKLARSGPEGAKAAKTAAEDAFKQVVPESAQPGETATAVTPEGAVTANGEPVVQFPGGKTQYDDLINAAKADFKTNPGAIMDEHLAEVSSLEAAGTKAAAEALPPLNDPANVGPLLRQMAIDLHDTPHVVKPDADMYGRAAGIAKEIGVDPNDLLTAAEQISGKMTDIDSAVTAMRGGWNKVTADVAPFASRGIEAITDAEIPKMKQAIHNAITYSGYFANIRSQSGRLLRSLKLDDLDAYLAKGNDTPVLGEFAGNPIKPLPQTRQEMGDWLAMWNATKADPGLRQDFLQGTASLPSAFKYARTSFANWFTASALSGLPSLSMNTVGPSIIGVLHTTEKTLGGAAAALLERNPARRAELLATSANAAKAYVQTIGDIPNVFRFAKQAFLENRGILGGGGTADDLAVRMGPITPEMIRATQGQNAPTWGYALGNIVNFLPRQFQRINASLDEFAKRLSYNGEVRLQALIDGGQQGLKGDALRSYVKKTMQDSIDEFGHAASDETLRTAERTTFTGSLAGNDYHPNVGRAANFVNSLRRDVPEFRYVAPIFNVPANSVGESIRRIPGVNLLLAETRDELTGSLGAVRQADAYGRTMLGGMFMLWSYSLARNGMLTGAGPQDPRDRQIWNLDHQPYSIKVGDHWVSYARYDLPGSLLAIPATLYDKTVNRTQDQDWEMAMIGGAGAAAQFFKDKAALQGVSQLMDFGANPSSDLGYVERLVGNTAARMAVPNFVTQMGRNVIDPEKRTKASIGDYITDALPWASQELDPMRNVLGEPQFKPNQTLIENTLPIVIASTRPNDAIIQELDRLYQATGYGGGVTTPAEISGGSSANGFYDPREVKLENGRSMYDAIMAARMSPSDDLDSSSLRNSLKELFASEDYQQATDGNANVMYDSQGDISKAALVSRAFSDYNHAAIREVAAQSPIARRYLAVSAAKRINGEALRPYSARRLVDAPDLLKALNIDINEFEDKLQ